jgi:hypothetical protein
VRAHAATTYVRGWGLAGMHESRGVHVHLPPYPVNHKRIFHEDCKFTTFLHAALGDIARACVRAHVHHRDVAGTCVTTYRQGRSTMCASGGDSTRDIQLPRVVPDPWCSTPQATPSSAPHTCGTCTAASPLCSYRSHLLTNARKSI